MLQHSAAALVTSGTATLETALFRVPQVVCYYVVAGQLASFIFKHFFHTKYISLVNLIGGREIVQELFGARFSESQIQDELGRILQDPAYRKRMLDGYDKIIHTLGMPGASKRTARLIVESLWFLTSFINVFCSISPRTYIFPHRTMKCELLRNKRNEDVESFLLVIGIALVSLTLPSCLDDDNSYSLGDIWIAVATVVPEGNNVYYLRLDDGDKLWPAATNYPNYQPKPNQRALVNFTILADSTQSNLGGFSHYIKVNAIHNILTKSIAKNEGAANDSIYGTDPVSIYNNNMWIGDGYLNIYFETLWGGKTAHFINLIQPDAENDPYTLEFRHNAYDDPQYTIGAGRVAFNLSSLPDTKGETVDLVVNYWTSEGKQAYKLKYNSDKTKMEDTSQGYTNDSISNITDMK